MKRTAWSAIAGFGVAGLLVAAPPAQPDEQTRTSQPATTATDTNKTGKTTSEPGTTATDTNKTGKTTSEPGTTATDTNKTGKTTSDSTSGARGSGMGGTSTGARPGEVTGTAPGGPSAGATAQAKNHVAGRIEKFDRRNRTLSLVDSDKTLTLTDDTEVTKDGQKVSPGQLMEGDDVRASYTGAGDTLRVDRLEVTSKTAGTATPGAGATSSPSSPGSATSSETGSSSPTPGAGATDSRPGPGSGTSSEPGSSREGAQGSKR
jgi:hypothetical protein